MAGVPGVGVRCPGHGGGSRVVFLFLLETQQVLQPLQQVETLVHAAHAKPLWSTEGGAQQGVHGSEVTGHRSLEFFLNK